PKSSTLSLHDALPISVRFEVEPALAELILHHAGGLGAKTHGLRVRECIPVAPADPRAHPGHRSDKVLDHAVGVRMIDVESIQLRSEEHTSELQSRGHL